MREKLDIDPLANRLPGQFEQRLLQFGKPALGVPTRYETGGSAFRISARTSSLGMPRSMIQMRTALPYWASILRRRRAASCGRRCCPAAPHRQAESRRASRSVRSPPGRSLGACRGCSRNAACRSRRPAAMTQNRCWSDHRAALRNWRRTNPASVGADDRTAPSCAPAACRGSGRGHSSPPAHNRRPADPPSRSARTTSDASATRCRDRSTGGRPASAGCAATASLDASPADAPTRTDRVPAAHRADTPASTRPIAAAGATPSPRAAPAAVTIGARRNLAISRNNANWRCRRLPSSKASIRRYQASN